jgi:hypothetical protein
MAKINMLTGGHKRSAHCLAVEIRALAKRFGLPRLALLTLTFKDHVLDIWEAQRRFHSLATHILKHRYARTITVWERQESGRIHFHLIIVLAADIRTGLDFAALKARDYRSANAALRSEWAFWRKTAPAYGFGRCELLPIKSNEDGIAYYVGGYISENIRARIEGDKGARLVRYGGYRGEPYLDQVPKSPTFGQEIKFSHRTALCRFGWVTESAWLWRHKLKAWAARMGFRNTEDIAQMYGARWCYHLQEQILREPVNECFPSKKAAARSRAMERPAFEAAWRAAVAESDLPPWERVTPPPWDQVTGPVKERPAHVYPIGMLR